MSNPIAAFAKLAGVLKSVRSLLEETKHKDRIPVGNFRPNEVEAYFNTTFKQLSILKTTLSEFYEDFSDIETDPVVKMMPESEHPYHYNRKQLEKLARDIEQIFELRASSELAAPVINKPSRIFISHGQSNDWREVQQFIEKDMKLSTLELAQEPNRGRTVLQKLDEESSRCSYAVIVMTGDDVDSDGVVRARENVMHEIGFLQGSLGLSAVSLLYEEGTNIPSNIDGLVYIPFSKGTVIATFGVLMRELNAFYKL